MRELSRKAQWRAATFYGISTFMKITPFRTGNFRSVTKSDCVVSPCWKNTKQGISYALLFFHPSKELLRSRYFDQFSTIFYSFYSLRTRCAIDSSITSSITLCLFPECYVHVFNSAPGFMSQSGHLEGYSRFKTRLASIMIGNGLFLH